jgi:hypothetical protein
MSMRKWLFAVVLTVVMLMFSVVAFGQEEFHWTGNTYQQFVQTHIHALVYTFGLADGIYIGAALEESKHGAIQGCLAKLTRGQVTTMIQKYLTDHPERWHEEMSILALRSLVTACPDLPVSLP